MKSSWRKTFEHPGAAWRGKPFWAWNGLLNPAELRRQIRCMAEMGLGGFFMHARVGLATPYLSDAWFEAVGACTDEAAKLGLEAWLYDEDRWPSGAAGGLVTRDPRWRMRYLDCVVADPGDPRLRDGNVLAVFSAEVEGDRVTSPQRLEKDFSGPLPRGRRLLVCFTGTAQPCSWYNGQTYLDTMNPEAVRRFIATTHEAYRKRFGKLFGSVVPGIFTDEPHRGAAFAEMQGTGTGSSIPWTPALPAAFRKRYGYDLLDRLPELFFEVDGERLSAARRDYYDCTTHLFCEAFGRLYGSWCERQGLLMTGHLLMEDRLSDQTTVVGNCMRFYEYMQAPGMDLLTETWRIFDTAKQVSSVAHQFGRRWRLTETYGCTGWDFPFAGHKALGDWQVALGINLRCQHLAFYTMEGQAKRDFPPAISFQSPWWPWYGKVEDYFARILSVMTRGEETRDLLVLHPVESLWAGWRRGVRKSAWAGRLDRQLRDLGDTLLAAHIDFDYGEEDLLARYGKVERSRNGVRLRLNQARYTAVLAPPMLTIRGTTLDLLRRFAAAGGRVVFAGRPPDHVDARPSGAARELATGCLRAPARGPELAAALAGCRRVSIAGPDGEELAPVLYLLKEDRDAYYLFLCNLSHEFRGRTDSPPLAGRRLAFDDVRVRGFSGARGRPVEADPETGRRFAADARKEAGGWTIRTSLPRLGSRLFIVPRKPSAERLPKRPVLHTVRRRALAPHGGWRILLSEANVLVLDRPRLRLGKGPLRPPEEILRVDERVRTALGLPLRGGAMAQPWTRVQKDNPPGVETELRYTFTVRRRPDGDLFLGLERPERYRVLLNGAEISTLTDAGWWTDPSLRRIPLDPALLRAGANELRLRCRYDENHPGFEIVYLLGSFGVRVRGADPFLTAPPERLRTGDWTRQGLPFYAGNVTYLATVRSRLARDERLFLRVPSYCGVALRILVDGAPAGLLAWEPQEIDLTEAARGGAFDLGIEILGHRRNAFGPLHLKRKEAFTGPHSFIVRDNRWTDGYKLVACGLSAAPEWHVRKAWHRPGGTG